MLSLDEVVRHVRRERRLLGLTQSRLAQEAKTSQSLIAKLEQNRLNPSYETIRQVMEALDRLRRGEEPTARDLMHKKAIFAKPDERLADVLSRMKRHGFSQMPVLDGGQPVGSLSEGVLLDHIERGSDINELKTQPVERVMRGSFPTVTPESSRRTLVELLRENDAVLVMDGRKLLGLVTKSDLW